MKASSEQTTWSTIKAVALSKGGKVLIAFVVSVFAIVILLCRHQIWPASNKSEKIADCSYLEGQNKQLVQFIMDMQKKVDAIGQPTSFLDIRDHSKSDFMYASFVLDTIKPTITKVQMQLQARTISHSIDSMMRKVQVQDSINRSKKQ